MVEYEPVWRTPLCNTFRNHKIYAPPAPASGAILLSALGTLDFLATKGGPTDVAEAHDTIEALRLAYGQRTLLGDPAFVDDAVQHAWLTEKAGRERAQRVGEATREPGFYLA